MDQFAQSPETAPLSLQGQISATLTSFGRTVDDYQRAAENEMVQERREKAQVRIETFKNEILQAREKFKDLKQEREESLHANNKQELFARRVPHESSSSSTNNENPYSGENNVYTDMARDEGLRQEGSRLGRIGEQLDMFLEQGQATLGDLGTQSQILRNSRQTIVNTMSTLGMSNETIRMVERRAFQDKWIFWGCVLFTFFGFWMILRYFG